MCANGRGLAMAWNFASFCPAVLSEIKVIVFRHTPERLRSRRGLLPIIVQMLKHRFQQPRYSQTACYLQAVHPAFIGLASVMPAGLESDSLLLRFVAGLVPTARR